MRKGLLLGGLLLAVPLSRAAAQQAVDTGQARIHAGADASAPATTRGRAFAEDFVAGLLGTGHTITAPLRWPGREWLVLPAGAGGLALLSRLDQPVHRMLDRNHSSAVDHALTTIEPFGTKYAIGTVVGTYLVGLAVRSPALRRTGVEAATSSVVAAGLVTPTLKLLVGRSRPWERKGAFEFHALSGQESFPSGHTTQAFAAASVFAAEARPLALKAAAYGLAGGVAGARLVHDAHFLSDVTAAACIGTITGRAVVRWEREHPGSWAPYVGREGMGVSHSFR